VLSDYHEIGRFGESKTGMVRPDEYDVDGFNVIAYLRLSAYDGLPSID
jgi:hypothetical protein